MKKKPLYHGVARSILAMIEAEGYFPGTRLPGERELAKRFGVSRVVIREAQISLEAVGRLDIKGGSGAYVLDTNISAGSDVSNVTAFGLTQTRLLFESECAALAATRITNDQIMALEQTIERMAAAPLGSSEGDEADHAFHLLIAKATGNEANVVVLENIWRMRNEIDAVKYVYEAVGHTDSSDRVSEHSEVMDALRNRDPALARKAMRKHFARLLNALLDFSEREAIEDVRRKSNENRKRYFDGGMNTA